jgi:DNA repair exonuclease SbcCD ATPase subunit
MAAMKKELDTINPVKPELMTEPVKPTKSGVTEAKTLLRAAEQSVTEFADLVEAAECDRCHQTITPETFKEILGSLTEASSIKYDEHDRIAVEYKSLEGKWLDAMADWDTYSTKLRKYEQETQRREQILKEYIEVHFDAEEQGKLDAEIIIMQSAREAWAKLDQQRTTLKSTVYERADIELHLEDLEYLRKVEDDPELDSVVAENENIEHQLNGQLNDVTSEQAHTEGRSSELNRLVSTMKETKKSINTNYLNIANKKAMQDNFVLFKRHLTAKIRPLLQQVAETLFHKTTKDRYASFNLSNDYEITLTTHTGYVRKLSTISGSENDLACLCLRLAIATLRSTKLAGSLGFIILDEISGSFDDERTKQTLEGLLELKDVIPQIINITHKPVEMKYADRLFTVKEINGTSVVTTM